ncbi:MAG: D-alanine--D-alanine ligase family protein [Oscillospiraceae bacterium]|nr:D-alanine--D-alanine ligase family protein [Oscillospiraceae bacterium]
MMNLLVLFGGVSPEHEVSLRSVEFVLNNIDRSKYHVYPVGITKEGVWKYYPSENYAMIRDNQWQETEGVCAAALSPSRGQGLLLMKPQGLETVPIHCCFPVLHGENGEDGSIQGLMQVAGIPCVGPGVAASASCMDKTISKLLVGETGVRQANWYLARRQSILEDLGRLVRDIESGGSYPLFVKPSGTGSSVGVSKVKNTQELKDALKKAAQYDEKVLVEEFISGHEVEVAVLGNKNPIASVVGEVIAGAEFYDYDAKYNSPQSRTEIPADISEDAAERLRKAAVTVYEAMGCKGLSRVDFFLTYEGEEVVFNEINTIPGFTSISMYPKLFEAAGVPNQKLIEELISLAMEA